MRPITMKKLQEVLSRTVWSTKVFYLVYFYHFTGFAVCLASQTRIHKQLFVDHEISKSLYFITVWFFATFFYHLTIKGPGYPDVSESAMDGHERWFCKRCNMSPPLRSSHCNTCGRCILRRDHHCPWLGCCVGMENHLFFLLFLFFETLNLQQFISQTWPAAQVQHPSFIFWFFTSFPCSVIWAVAILSIFQTIILLPIHFTLMLLNQTTWELFKSGSVTYMRDWKLGFSPFSKGFLQNIKEFCTMRWNHPLYEIPEGEALDQWRRDNIWLVNDWYECC